MEQSYTEQAAYRREKLEQLYSIGVNPYPYAFDADTTSEQIKARPEWIRQDEQEPPKRVSIAGRIMTRRIMGKAAFFNLQDSQGSIQVYIRRDDVGTDNYNKVFKKMVDIGDIVGISGFIFKTKTGELTVHAESFQLLGKALRPIPVAKEVEEDGGKKVYDAFSDREQRYRQRYLDLIVNPEVREVFRQRSLMIQAMRRFMLDRGYLEVETPILQPVYGGAAAEPFETHHNALDMKLYLRIANELYLKRLIIGGFDGVFEFAKDFRNEGMSRFHNPEFTQVELYVAYKDYHWMMDFTEQMLEHVVQQLHGTTCITVGDRQIDFKRPWPRLPMLEAIEQQTGKRMRREGSDALLDADMLRRTAKELGCDVDETMGPGKIIDEIFGDHVEPTLIQPTFITDYPIEMSPLAKKHRSKEGLVERFEMICNQKELCNAFSELNDPVDQRQRLEEQARLRAEGDEEAMTLDEDFLRALEYGMPPTAGLGVGIDRLAMILTNQDSIRDVLLFPHMRPEEGQPAEE